MSLTRFFPQAPVSRKPTPIHRLNRLSEKYNREIYCLRDDLTGLGFGGNKTRKLDYLIGDARRQNCTTLIGIGAQQSNFCRLTAIAGAHHGLQVQVILSGEEPDEYSGNLLLMRLAQAEIQFVGNRDRAEAARDIEGQLLQKGQKVYRMPYGGSTAVGCLGYVEALEQIRAFEREQGLQFSKLFHASSSGGTQSGLVAGKILLNWPGQIIGISVENSTAVLQEKVRQLSQDTLRLLKTEAAVAPEAIQVDDTQIGEGYGIPTPNCEAAVEEWLRLEGIPLDFVYSGKGAAGLLSHIKAGQIAKKEAVLFIHTGGNVQLFAKPYSL